MNADVSTADLPELLQEKINLLLLSMKDKLREYERENGLVKPVPARGRTPKYPSLKQSLCICKRELIRIGEYEPPE